MPTSNPSTARSSAVALPIPESAPVTIASRSCAGVVMGASYPAGVVARRLRDPLSTTACRRSRIVVISGRIELMFDWTHLDELDGNRAADALARSRDVVMWAEAEQLQLAAHWADLHTPDFVEDCRAALPGMERAVPSGADGCPMMAEFAGAELAALLGRTTASGEQLVADAVNLRHRHPLLWTAIRRGE